jgi:hypothetical protein
LKIVQESKRKMKTSVHWAWLERDLDLAYLLNPMVLLQQMFLRRKGRLVLWRPLVFYLSHNPMDVCLSFLIHNITPQRNFHFFWWLCEIQWTSLGPFIHNTWLLAASSDISPSVLMLLWLIIQSWWAEELLSTWGRLKSNFGKNDGQGDIIKVFPCYEQLKRHKKTKKAPFQI